MRLLLMVALASILGVALSRAAAAQAPTPAPGEIRGVVFYDRNDNGVRDAGEAGLQDRQITLLQGDHSLQTVTTDYGGEYVFSSVTPGEYTVTAAINGRIGICADGAATFSPFPSSYCAGPTMPWDATTPTSLPVTKMSEAVPRVEFGARPADVAVVMGLALLEDGYAQPGTSIQAIVNGQVCGSTAVPSADGGYIGDHMFELHILGLGEQAGCATPGALVQFRVGGVVAAESFSWAPFSDVSTFGQFQLLFLTAMQQHAWYWYEQSESEPPAVGTRVQAVIGGTVCGEARIEAQGTGLSGFSKLIVPSADLQPGCGRPGVPVSFVFDGVTSPETIRWQPGLEHIIPSVVPIAFPRSGGDGLGGDADSWPAGLFAASGSLLVLLGFAGARRRTNSRDPRSRGRN